MKVTFSQINAPEVTPTGNGPALIEGVGPALPRGVPGEMEPEPPATMGAYNVRHQEATNEDSALSNLVAPVCGDVTCQATVVTDASTPSMRVISMIGAAFPNGSHPPQLAFRIPE